MWPKAERWLVRGDHSTRSGSFDNPLELQYGDLDPSKNYTEVNGPSGAAFAFIAVEFFATAFWLFNRRAL